MNCKISPKSYILKSYWYWSFVQFWSVKTPLLLQHQNYRYLVSSGVLQELQWQNYRFLVMFIIWGLCRDVIVGVEWVKSIGPTVEQNLWWVSCVFRSHSDNELKTSLAPHKASENSTCCFIPTSVVPEQLLFSAANSHLLLQWVIPKYDIHLPLQNCWRLWESRSQSLHI